MKNNEKTSNALGKKKKYLLLGVGVVILALIIGILVYYENNLVYKICRVEAGVEVSLSDFLMKPNEKATFTDQSEKYDTRVPGEYHLKIKTGLFAHSSTLIVEDTIAPVIEVKDMVSNYGEQLEAKDFVTKVEDATKVSFSYSKKPDFEKTGTQEVEICATDLGKNVTKASAKLVIWPVKKIMEVEAGGEVPAIEDFLLDTSLTDVSLVTDITGLNLAEIAEACGVTLEDGTEFVTDMSLIEMNHVATYYMMIQDRDSNYPVELKITDTKAPELTLQDVEGYAIVKREAASFVANCVDDTSVTFSYETEPDFNKLGEQELTIVATDEGGNVSKGTVKLTLKEDTEAPVITGASDMGIYIGQTISYRNVVKATDNCPEELQLVIDSSKVNTNAEGTYPVHCEARDAAGNVTTADFNVTVKLRVYSEEEVYALADAALASCITPDMSPLDKVTKIYWYIRGNLSFYDTSEKGNWLKGAGDAFVNRRGDCYNYACMAKAMLTRAGITNMDIERIPAGNNLHYWNLVDIGDGHGWYHFDTTPRVDGNPTILLWTDAQMMEYSQAHGNCFNYDRAVYPVIP